MFKKALQVVTAFGVLLAGYAGYVRLFAILAEGLGTPHRAPERPFGTYVSRTKKEAIDLAAKAFGPHHWSADKDLQVRYYNHDRGYWMYAKAYERRNGGKQFLFKPFALISQSRDGKVLKTATSDVAVIDLDQALGLPGKSDSPMRVVHARIEGDVRLRDDKGTPPILADDLVIGPLTYVEFDEPSLKISSESDILIQDRDMRITGYGLQIDLRPKDEAAPPGAPAGFNPKTAYLRKDVHIILGDVGPSGILPGKAKSATGPGPASRTPLDVRSAGLMQVDLPRPRLPVKVGPPAPPAPTFVSFARDVVVLRGKPGQLPDQLNCDNLRLILLPSAKAAAEPKPAAGEGEAAGAGVGTAPLAATGTEAPEARPAPLTGAGTELALREARASGHAVWLQSKAQNVTARCNELIHKKLAPEQPDETYLRGDARTKLWVEKLDIVADGPDKGKVQGVTTIRTIDATIFDDGQGNDNATVVARGPGQLETRPGRDKPVERKATWQDHLIMQTEIGPDKRPSKKITLTGQPEFIDPAQATLDARKMIVVWLKPKPAPSPKTDPNAVKAAAPAGTANQAFQIEKLVALEDVHLNAPGKILTARDRLDATFEAQPTPAGPKASGPSPPRGPAATPVAATPTDRPANESAPGTPASLAQPEGRPQAPRGAGPPPEPAPKPAEPGVTVEANRVWAQILLKPEAEAESAPGAGTGPATAAASPADGRGMLGASNNTEVKLVRLRGKVAFHQDPAPGKPRGTDVTGEALDLFNFGDGKSKFLVDYREDPNRPLAPAALALTPHARVVTEEMTITGPTIGLDQSIDRAWVQGPGTLTQQARRGLLNDKGPADEDRRASAGKAPAANRGPLTISWKKEMQFYGRADDRETLRRAGRPVARAEFHEGVRGLMDDALIACQEKMLTYMDRTVALTRPGRAAKAQDGEPPAEDAEPKPEIALIDCFKEAVVISRKLDPDTRVLLQQQRLEGDRLTYDKRTGDFLIPGAGQVLLWNREGQGDSPTKVGASGPGEGPEVILTANPAGTPPRPARATAVIGRNGSQFPGSGPSAAGRGGARVNANAGSSSSAAPDADADADPRARARARSRAKARQLAPLKQTRISFTQAMKGRFLTGEEGKPAETRWADFFGDVQTLNAKVEAAETVLDFDRPPPDGMFLTAQTLRVISEPAQGDAGAARNFLKAWDDANAKTQTETIQADVITYDSLKELFYAYGNDGRQVVIAQVATTGQAASTTHGRAVVYNRQTGESQLMDPVEFQFVDAKTGVRPGPPAEGKIKPPKSPRSKLRLPGRSTIERRGMNGR